MGFLHSRSSTALLSCPDRVVSDSPFSLARRTILVTGASSGLGRQIAISCADMGATLIVSGRDSKRLHDTLQSLAGSGHRAITGELTDTAQLQTARR